MFNRRLQKALACAMMGIAVTTVALPISTEQMGKVMAASDNLVLKDISIDGSTSNVQGTRITLSAQCTGGAGEYTYSYGVMLPNGKYETIAEETNRDSINYTLNEVGTYNFLVRVTDGYDVVTDTIECQATRAKVALNNIKLNKVSFKSNDTVKFTVNATAASGTVKSKIVLKMPNGKNVLVKGYSSKMTASYKVKKKGTYKATISVKDSKSSTSKTIQFKVK